MISELNFGKWVNRAGLEGNVRLATRAPLDAQFPLAGWLDAPSFWAVLLLAAVKLRNRFCWLVIHDRFGRLIRAVRARV